MWFIFFPHWPIKSENALTYYQTQKITMVINGMSLPKMKTGLGTIGNFIYLVRKGKIEDAPPAPER